MRPKRRLTSGDLLLAELIFAILFFSLTMAATMSVFGRAYEMSGEAAAGDRAVDECSAAAEIVRAADTEEELKESLEKFGLVSVSGEKYEKTYGDDKYVMTMDLSDENGLISADISCFSKKEGSASGEPVFNLLVKHVLREEGRNGR